MQFKLSILFFLIIGFAFSHEWQDLTEPDLTTEKLEQLISIAEKEQANFTQGTPLAVDAFAIDWLEWFSEGLELFDREGQTAFKQRLQSAGYHSESEDALGFWEHDMAHLALVFDASSQSVNQQEIEASLASLTINQTDPASLLQAQRLTYSLSLIYVTDTDKALIVPFSERINRLLGQAKGQTP